MCQFLCMYFISCNSTEFIYSNSVLVELLGFPVHVTCGIVSSANSDIFTSFFPILLPFISFSCVTDPTGTRNTLFNKSNKSGHPCFVSDLREKLFSFSPSCMMLTVSFFIYYFSYIEVCSLYS